MSSNTKITEDQKADAKSFLSKIKTLNPGTRVYSCPQTRVTILLIPSGFDNAKMSKVYVSLASIDEEKFRRWVGVYNCLARYNQDEYIQIKTPKDEASFGFCASMLADVICGDY